MPRWSVPCNRQEFAGRVVATVPCSFVRAFSLLLLGACGRLSFDPLSERAGDARPSDVADADTCAVGGAIGAWSMNDSELSGTTLRDVSGKGHDGTLVGSPEPALAAGPAGQALDYSATSLAYVNVPSLPLDATTGAFTTVTLWFRNDNPNVSEGVFCMPAGPSAAPPRYCMWLTNQGGPITLCINGGEGECWGITDNGLIGRWVHVAAVYVNGPTTGGTFFVDGAPVSMSCVFGTCDKTRVTQGPFEIGNSDPNYPWRGSLDDVRVFDRALDADEVARVMACPH